jgi:DNA repair exonuclease SbcCD ATPase subunit
MSPATKSNVSPGIQAVAAKFTERPSESALSSYTTNAMPKSSSPERSLVKGHHKRMQSLQPSDTKADARSEFLNYLESRSPERPLRATILDPTNKQETIMRAGSPTSRSPERDLPSYVSNRYLSKPIIGETTPSSPTMLALQNMQLPEVDPPSPSRAPKMIAAAPAPTEPEPARPIETQKHTMGTLASQIHCLTDIASSLQREMSNLSRRSKDNATDLVSLKAATNARDEDIRKSLKELTSNLSTKFLDVNPARFDFNALLKREHGIDSSDPDSSPNSKRSYSVPRMPSPSLFNFDRDFAGSPGPISDGSASIALLEKVLREMATKEGEERLLELVDEIKSRPATTASDKESDQKITNMLEEILNLVKEDPSSRALVRAMSNSDNLLPGDNLEGARPRSMGSMDPSASVRPLDVLKGDKQGLSLSGNDEILAILRIVKNTVIESGGMTNSVKALVRELRGEVLGMGRDLARRLETVDETRAIGEEQKPQTHSPEEISAIINESLEGLREQLAATINESRQHSSAFDEFQSTMNSAAIYSIVKRALDELELPQPEAGPHGSVMEKEEILETVREAMETYRPEIELQNFGLERDEVLECLSEGLKSYQPQHEDSLTYEQVLGAVRTGLLDFQPPGPPAITRDEIIMTIRECLENFEPTSRGLDEEHVGHLHSMRDEILGAVAGVMEKPTPRGFDDEHVNHLNTIRDEILGALAESMEKHGSQGLSEEHANLLYAIRDEIMGAVTENNEKIVSRGLDEEQIQYLNSVRDDILHAVTETQGNAESHGLDEQHFEHLNAVRDEIMGAMTEIKEKPASGGLDDEHIQYLNSIRDDILHALAEAMTNPTVAKTMDEEHRTHMNDIRDEILSALTGSMATQSMISKESFDSGIGRDDILSAVSDGLEAHFTTAKDTEEPRISTSDVVNAINDAFDAQHSALSTSLAPPTISREDIMAAIADGIEIASKPQEPSSLSREEITSAIADAMEIAHKPTEASALSRDDILSAVSEALEKSREADQSALTTNIQQPSITREELFNAVVDGIESANTMTREIELNKDDLMEAISAGLQEATSATNANVGDEVLGRLQEVVNDMKEEFKQYSAASGKDTEQVLDAIKDGLDVVRKEIETYVGSAHDGSDKLEIIDTVKEGFRLLQADMEKTIHDTSLSNASRATPDTPELLEAMEKEFEHLRGTISTLLVRDTASSDKDEIIDAIREIGEQSTAKGADEDVLNTLKQEFENMRERMEMTVVRSEPSSEKEDILTALREHFDNLREETRAKDGTESMLSTTSELLDAFNDGIDCIREDIKKVAEKSTDFDSSEILDTLKDGLAVVRADIDALREAQKSKELDEEEAARGGELTLAKDAELGGGIESLKTLIADLQEKVEAIDSTPRAAEPAEDALNKGHMDEVLVAIQEVQVAIGEIAADHSNDLHENAARKEDTDAIQELLMGTKTHLEELVFPAPDTLATSEHIGNLETMVKEAKDTITDLSSRLEAEAPTKAEVGALEGLIKDVWMALEELKGKTKEAEEEGGEDADSDKLMKSDLQTVEAMIFEVKTQVDELKLPDVETLPTKDEIQALSTLVTDFREKMEADNDMTAQGFEARKVEHAGLHEKIEEAKFVIGELGDELKSKLDGSSEGLTELKQLLEGLALTAENFSTVESIKELTELINREFERARGEEDATKLEQEERDAAAMVKHDEIRAAIIVELGTKIDEKLGEVMAKYEEAHTSLHSKFAETEERDMAHSEAVSSTQALAEEIKLVIGEVGSTVNESCERMAADTKTLLEKVDESYNRMEELQNEAKSQQEQSKEGHERAVAATERVESKLLEFNPQILETVQQILTVVSEHYDHSQKSSEDFKSELSALPSNIPSMLPALMPPPEAERDVQDDPVHTKLNDILEHATKNSQVHEVLNTLLEHSKNDQLHEKLDRALDQSSGNDQIYEKLDKLLEHAASGDGSVHEKLDALLSRPATVVDPDQSVNQMMKLDEMHRDIMENTRKMNEMFAAQSALVAEDTERKRREAEEAAIALERRIAQREQVEAELVGLHEEKDSLLKMLQALKTEKDDMTKQNQKLSKDLSGLETALEIRHEEMQQMEDRADGLEKRILEGVLDHARTVLLSRSGSLSSMNLKRNRSVRSSRAGARSPSAMSNATASTAKELKDPRSILGNGVGMALKRRTPNHLQAGTTAVQPNIGKERRILSLSHVTGNRGASGGLTNLKRSNSVKSNFSLRKSSWAGHSTVSNKENEVFREEDEHDSEPESDAGTERRTSYAPSDRKSSYAGTDRRSSYAGTVTDSVVTGPTESVVSEDRRTSGMSSVTGQESSIAGDSHMDESYVESESEDAQTARESDDELDEEEDDPDNEYRRSIVKDENEVQDGIDEEISAMGSAMEAEALKLLGPPADSGLGSETAV